MDIAALLRRFPRVSDQVDEEELAVILSSLAAVSRDGVPGDVVEFGCYVGTTSLFLQRWLEAENAGRTLYVYDSFEGLPAKTAPDESPAGTQFQAGSLAASKTALVRNFQKAGLRLPIITKGWFNELTPADVPASVSFAFLDGDYYESIKHPLRLLTPVLSPGAVIVVDDYRNEALPGAARAVDEWLAGRPQAKLRVQASLAIITV